MIRLENSPKEGEAMNRTFLSTIFVFVTLISFWSSQVYACKCAGQEPKTAYANSDFAVIAEQISSPDISKIRQGQDSTSVLFRINSVIKGELKDGQIKISRALDVNVMCQSFLIKRTGRFLLFLVGTPKSPRFLSDCYSASYQVENNSVSLLENSKLKKVSIENLKDFLSQVH